MKLDLSGKRVVVVGAAKSGQAAARLAQRLNAKVKVSDAASEEKVDEDFRRWGALQGIPMEFGGHTRSFIEDSDLLVVSPGVRIDAQPLRWAREKNIAIWGEIELAFRVCSKPVIAITGSNGKTTVSTLIAEMIDHSGKKAILCGNVGTPFSDYVLDAPNADYFVLELSSFQLETIKTFRPHVAVLLNFSQNHLDRHRNLEEYFIAKKRIFENQTGQDFAVLNKQDPRLAALASQLKGHVVFFNDKNIDGGLLPMPFVNNPNFLAAATAARILNIPSDIFNEVLRQFPGVEHRMEVLGEIDGVLFINDSKATTTEAGRWALQRATRPVVMICGGRDKNADFTVMREIVRQKVKHMIVYGEAREKLQAAFEQTVPLNSCPDLAGAVSAARTRAQAGDCVLLSPMCTSFDSFRNYAERGRAFKEIVNQLSAGKLVKK